MFCVSCGRRIGKTARFCPQCGADQTVVAPEESLPDAEVQTADVRSEAIAENTAVVAVAVNDDVGDTTVEDGSAELSSQEGASATQADWLAAIAPFMTKRNKTVAAVAALSLLVLLIVGALIATGIQANHQKQAAARAAVLAAAQRAKTVKEKALVTTFDSFMSLRQKVLVAEAAINDEVTSAKAKRQAYWLEDGRRDAKIKADKAAYERRTTAVTNHNDSEDTKHAQSYYTYYSGYTQYYSYSYTQSYWDYPSEPGIPKVVNSPSFTDEARSTRDAVGQLTTVLATLTASPPKGELNSDGTQLVEVTKTLIDAGNHNADLMATAVKSKTKFDAASLFALRKGAASGLLAKLNDTALVFIKHHQLDIRVYDIAGGRDSTPDDSSMLTASAGN
jgi:hypothetical protein